ncbi:hypothetical protein QAD02_002138 [Eretmocerus hayati]|uniref:Uncharacterized protein n=1 Tax=Eretmocerus hayati TaxID=131215 RepID=A0ACC2NKN5_9HYME|nr:hypothetical protein QAD02_002138 [Eretmocerus hayati]
MSRVTIHDEHRKIILNSIRQNFLNNIQNRLSKLPKNSKNWDSFEKKYQQWLDGIFKIEIADRGIGNNPDKVTKRVGRPYTPIESASERSLRRRQDKLVVEMKVVKAARMSRIEDFNLPPTHPMPEPVVHIEELPCDRFQRIDVPKFSPLQALAVLVNANLTKEAYAYIASSARKIGNNIFPSYPSVNIC